MFHAFNQEALVDHDEPFQPWSSMVDLVVILRAGRPDQTGVVRHVPNSMHHLGQAQVVLMFSWTLVKHDLAWQAGQSVQDRQHA